MSNFAKVVCNHCGGHVEYPVAEYEGKVIPCPHCQKDLLLRNVAAPPLERIKVNLGHSPDAETQAPHRPPVTFKVRLENWNEKNETWWAKKNRVPLKGKLTIGDGKLEFSGKQDSIFGKSFTNHFPLSEVVNVEQSSETVTFDRARDGERYMAGVIVHAANNKDAAAIVSLLPSQTTNAFVEKQEEKAAFTSALTAVTPVAWMTPTIVALNVLMYLITGIAGVGWFAPEPDKMVSWGADFWPLTTDGEWWRLLTNTFLHFGIVHLCFNMVALINGGTFTERLFGNKFFAAIYLFGMLASSIGSDWWYHNDKVVCAGASGVIFAVYGALLACLVFQQKSFPKDSVKPLITNALVFVGYNVFYGAAHEGISNAAHLTGLAAGFVSGIAFCRPLDAASRKAQTMPRFAIGVTVCAVVIAGSLYFMPKSTGLTTEDLQTQIQDSIKQKFSESADTRSIKIKKFGLVRENGNKYKGLLEVERDNATETLDIDVTYDGRNFMWEVLPQNQTAPPQVENSPRPSNVAPAPARPHSIVVKGFYIGMAMEDAIMQAKQAFPADGISVFSSDNEILQKAHELLGTNYSGGNAVNNEIDCTILGGDSATTLEFDGSDKSLKDIFFSAAAVNYVFNASELNPEEFAKQFVNAYNIPNMESRETTSDDAAWHYEWRYIGADGVTVDMSQKDKRFEIHKTDAGQTKGNFN